MVVGGVPPQSPDYSVHRASTDRCVPLSPSPHPEISSGHVLLIRPGRELQPGAAAVCFHRAGEKRRSTQRSDEKEFLFFFVRTC